MVDIIPRIHEFNKAAIAIARSNGRGGTSILASFSLYDHVFRVLSANDAHKYALAHEFFSIINFFFYSSLCLLCYELLAMRPFHPIESLASLIWWMFTCARQVPTWVATTYTNVNIPRVPGELLFYSCIFCSLKVVSRWTLPEMVVAGFARLCLRNSNRGLETGWVVRIDWKFWT